MRERHRLWMILLGLAVGLAAAACGEGDSLDGDPVPNTTRGADTETTTTITARDGDPTTSSSSPQDPGELIEVIIDLAVPWQPEPDLPSEEAIAEQRAAIAEAQTGVLELLEGLDYRVIARYEVTAQMAIAITGEGISRLNASDLVANVSIDVPEPPTG